MKKCPYCALEIEDEAIKCRFCNEMLEGAPGRTKWFFRPRWIIFAFLCLGPIALPLVWFNPRINKRAKVIITSVTVILTYYLGFLLIRSLKSIIDYYGVIMGGNI